MLNTRLSFRPMLLAVAAMTAMALSPAMAQDTESEIEGHFKGSADAAVTIVEFASVTCSHCKHFNDDLMPIVQEEYIDTGKIRLEMRPYALNSIDVAIYAVAECAGDDTFFPIVDQVFEDQQKVIKSAQDGTAFDYVVALAERHGLDSEEAVNACLANPDMRKRLIASMDSGDEIGVTGTPSFIVEGKLKRVDSDFASADAMRKYLDGVVSNAGASTSDGE